MSYSIQQLKDGGINLLNSGVLVKTLKKNERVVVNNRSLTVGKTADDKVLKEHWKSGLYKLQRRANNDDDDNYEFAPIARPKLTPAQKESESRRKLRNLQYASEREEEQSVRDDLQRLGNAFSRFTVRIVQQNRNQMKINVEDIEGSADPYKFMQLLRDHLHDVQKLIQFRQFKFSLSVSAQFHKATDENVVTDPPRYFNARTRVVLKPADVESAFDEMEVDLLDQIETFVENGSGWVFDHMKTVHFSVAIYTPLKSGSYIPIPKWLEGAAKKAGVVNIKNDCNNCFKYSIISEIKPNKAVNKNKPEYYKKELAVTTIDFTDVLADDKGVPLHQLPKFEQQNKFAIYVFEVDVNSKDQIIYPVYPSNFKRHYSETVKKGYRVIDLLRLVDGENSHFCRIGSIAKLLHSQLCGAGRDPIHFCRACCGTQTTEEARDNHNLHCHEHDSQRVTYPEPGTRLELKKDVVMKKRRAPYVMYGDFECIMPPSNTSKGTATTLISSHQMCGYALKGVAPTMPLLEKLDLKHGLGEDFEKSFFKQIEENVITFAQLTQQYRETMELTDDEKVSHKSATCCYLCHEPFDNDKSRDHDHSTKKYLGAAHSKCNLYDKTCSNVYVLFHNFRNYDSHLLFKHLTAYMPNVSVIGPTDEKFMSLTIAIRVKGCPKPINVHFHDSLLFLTSGLDKVVDSLANVNEDEGRVVPDTSKFHHLKQYVNDFVKKHNKNALFSEYFMKMLCHKQFYPYEYFTSDTMFEEKNLPPIESFYSKLKDETCSPKAYDHAQTVFKDFDCKTLWDYHDLYLATDVILLADVFEHFRKLAMIDDQLDPVHYVSLPGFAWDSLMLKAEPILKPLGGLELISDPEMYLMVESGIRGGVSMISKRHAVANNKNMTKYDPNQTTSFIRYLDMNNMYGHGMSQYLPVNGFRWGSDDECMHYDPTKIDICSDVGSMSYISGYWPNELHDLHNDYPMLPERMKVNEQTASEYNESLRKKLGKTSSNVEKLVPHLDKRVRYTVHYRALAQAIKHGFVVTKVHRVIFFTQAPWMKDYIDHNTKLRALATNDFEKDFYKLKNNAVYGKTIENKRNHTETKIIGELLPEDQSKYRKYLNDGRLRYLPKLIGGLATFSLPYKKLELDKPIIVGMSILDISKEAIYSFHYDYMMVKYGPEKCRLLMTDTDSLVYHIETENWDDDAKPDSHLFDFSNYEKQHPLFNTTNKKVIRKMKNEFPKDEIVEFIGLKPKMYTLRMNKSKDKLVHKGVQKNAHTNKNNRLTFADYKYAFEKEESVPVSMNSIRSFRHGLHTVSVVKDGLSPDDDKRHLRDKVNSFAHGHWRISK
jgi:hypothetical protein